MEDERRQDRGDERRQDRRGADREFSRRKEDSPRYLDPGDSVFTLWGRVIRARYQRIAASLTRRVMQRPLRIGISARIFHPEAGATGLRSKNLQYLEESIAH